MRARRDVVVWGLLATFVVLLGCASIVSKSTYTVNLNSNPLGAKVTVKDERGVPMQTGTTPMMVTLKAGKGYFQGKNYTVTFSMPGYEDHTAFITQNLDGWYIGNILFGGVIGMLIVDPLTGAMWRLDPDMVMATLQKKTSALDDGKPALVVWSLSDVPQHLRPKMERLR